MNEYLVHSLISWFQYLGRQALQGHLVRCSLSSKHFCRTSAVRQRLHEIASQLQSAGPIRFWMMRSQPGTPSNRGPGPPLPGMPGGGFPGTPGARALGLQSATLGLSWSDRIYGRYWRYHEFPLEKNTPNELQKPSDFLGKPSVQTPNRAIFAQAPAGMPHPETAVVHQVHEDLGHHCPWLRPQTSICGCSMMFHDVPTFQLWFGGPPMATLGSGPSRERANATLYPRVRNPVAIWTGQNDSTPLAIPVFLGTFMWV